MVRWGLRALNPLFLSRAPSLLVEEVEVAVGRGSGTDQFQHSQRKQTERNLTN